MNKYLFPSTFYFSELGQTSRVRLPPPAPHCLSHLKEKHGSSGLSSQQSLNLLTGNISASRSHTNRGPGRRWSHHFSKEAGQYLEMLPLPLGVTYFGQGLQGFLVTTFLCYQWLCRRKCRICPSIFVFPGLPYRFRCSPTDRPHVISPTHRRLLATRLTGQHPETLGPQ